MNRHQPDSVSCFVDLSFTFTTTDGFELFNVTNKVPNQIIAGAFKPGCECKQPLNVGESLCAIKIRGYDRHVFRFMDRKSKQVLDGVMVAPGDKFMNQLCRAIE